MSPFQRHIAACNTLASPAGLLPFFIAGQAVGWLAPDIARFLAFRPRDFHFDADGVSLAARLRTRHAREAALATAAADLARAGFCRLRGEPFDIRGQEDGPALATLDRGALPLFGIRAQGVHLNGLVRRADGLHLWLGLRAADKAIAPGKLDNLVAGGVPAGLAPGETLYKEAAEEAGLPAEMVARARPVGRVSYIMAGEGGMRRDVLHCYDLDLPEGFEPRPVDGEVARFELLPIAEVFALVRDTDLVKFNVNLVLMDLFLRLGLLEDADGSLRAGLDQVA